MAQQHASRTAVRMERLTLVDGWPFALASVWFPSTLAAPLLDGTVDFHQGVFDILERGLHLELGLSEYSIEATAADEAVARLLDVPTASPLVLLGTLHLDVDGHPVSLGSTRGRADRVRYEVQARSRGCGSGYRSRTSSIQPSSTTRPAPPRSPISTCW